MDRKRHCLQVKHISQEQRYLQQLRPHHRRFPLRYQRWPPARVHLMMMGLYEGKNYVKTKCAFVNTICFAIYVNWMLQQRYYHTTWRRIHQYWFWKRSTGDVTQHACLHTDVVWSLNGEVVYHAAVRGALAGAVGDDIRFIHGHRPIGVFPTHIG